MYYSKTLSAICEGTLTHPVTGEKYGGTDFTNEQKLSELQAIPITDSDGIIPENPVQTGTEIVIAEDGQSAQRVKTWRSKTEQELSDDLAAAKTAKIAEVNTVRASVLESLTVPLVIGENTLTFDADETGRQNLNGLLTAIALSIPVGETVLWRDSENVNQSLTVEQLQTLGAAMIAGVQSVFVASWTVKDTTIPALTTVAEVEAFDIQAALLS